MKIAGSLSGYPPHLARLALRNIVRAASEVEFENKIMHALMSLPDISSCGRRADRQREDAGSYNGCWQVHQVERYSAPGAERRLSSRQGRVRGTTRGIDTLGSGSN